MPDFSARFTAGTTLERWSDPPLGARPSRINPFVGGPHRYRRVELGTEVTVSAVVAGVTAPLDVALGGRLFFGWFAEHAGVRPLVTRPPGQSSVVRFTPTSAGHLTYVLRRRGGGGGVIIHLDVETS